MEAEGQDSCSCLDSSVGIASASHKAYSESPGFKSPTSQEKNENAYVKIIIYPLV